MSKTLLGLVLGGILGIFDGLTAWFTPAVRAQLVTIVIGSTVKGLIAGVLIGYFSRKVHSLPLGLAFGRRGGIAAGLRSRGHANPWRPTLLFRNHAARRNRGNDRWLCHTTFWRSANGKLAGLDLLWFGRWVVPTRYTRPRDNPDQLNGEQ